VLVGTEELVAVHDKLHEGEIDLDTDKVTDVEVEGVVDALGVRDAELDGVGTGVMDVVALVVLEMLGDDVAEGEADRTDQLGESVGECVQDEVPFDLLWVSVTEADAVFEADVLGEILAVVVGVFDGVAEVVGDCFVSELLLDLVVDAVSEYVELPVREGLGVSDTLIEMDEDKECVGEGDPEAVDDGLPVGVAGAVKESDAESESDGDTVRLIERVGDHVDVCEVLDACVHEDEIDNDVDGDTVMEGGEIVHVREDVGVVVPLNDVVLEGDSVSDAVGDDDEELLPVDDTVNVGNDQHGDACERQPSLDGVVTETND
jgi:hypothetical protein